MCSCVLHINHNHHGGLFLIIQVKLPTKNEGDSFSFWSHFYVLLSILHVHPISGTHAYINHKCNWWLGDKGAKSGPVWINVQSTFWNSHAVSTYESLFNCHCCIFEVFIVYYIGVGALVPWIGMRWMIFIHFFLKEK